MVMAAVRLTKFLSFLSLILCSTLFVTTHGATFLIQNMCSYTVWAAASPGGGRALRTGQTWTLNVPAGTKMARIWGRTGCTFDSQGRGKCQTGDCGGLLNCKGWGNPPNTLAEYALNQFGNLDFFDISLVDGFNIPMVFTPTNNFGGKCHLIKCTADIIGLCPGPLKYPHGCLNPCQVFHTPEYCCNNIKCGPTDYSKFFKKYCPDAYSYPQDDPSSTFTCKGGTNYKVVFCGRGAADTFPLQMYVNETYVE